MCYFLWERQNPCALLKDHDGEWIIDDSAIQDIGITPNIPFCLDEGFFDKFSRPGFFVSSVVLFSPSLQTRKTIIWIILCNCFRFNHARYHNPVHCNEVILCKWALIEIDQ